MNVSSVSSHNFNSLKALRDLQQAESVSKISLFRIQKKLFAVNPERFINIPMNFKQNNKLRALREQKIYQKRISGNSIIYKAQICFLNIRIANCFEIGASIF